MNQINEPYLLIAATCPCYVAPDGQRFLNELWAKDLALHPEYLGDLTVAAPCIVGAPPSEAVSVKSHPLLMRVAFVDLPAPSRTFLQAVLSAPLAILRLWSAIGSASIVHAGLVGWPYPIGWIGILIAKLRRKFVVIVVESAPWRIGVGVKPSVKQRARALIFETLNRGFVNAADLNVFTQEEYLHSMLPREGQRGLVINASWIEDEDILKLPDAQADWKLKVSRGQPLRLLFAARLTREKGLSTLLEAVNRLPSQPRDIELDIAGAGPLLADCEAFLAAYTGTVKMSLIGTVRYGSEFFALLRSYHAVLVPSITDEQPRIVYDAYSQAVPVLASDTAGLRSCVQDDVTGCLDAPGSAEGLARRLAWAADNVAKLESMGLAGLGVARGLTHRGIHQRRLVALEAALRRRAQS